MIKKNHTFPCFRLSIILVFFSIILVSCAFVCTVAHGQSLTNPIYDSNTSSDFAATRSAVGAGQVLVNGWTDQFGGIYTTASGALTGTTSDANGFTSKFLTRPTSESQMNGRVVVTLKPGQLNQANLGLVFRWQSGTKNHYLLNVAAGSNSTVAGYLYKVVGGTVTAIGSPTQIFTTYNATDVYTITGVVSGSPASLSVTASDVTAGTTGTVVTSTDTEASLQNAGQFGLSVWAVTNGTSVSSSMSRVQTFGPSAAVTGNVVFVGDSLWYGQNASSGQGTVTGTTLPADVLAALGPTWQGVNLGVSGKYLSQMVIDAPSQASANYKPGLVNVAVLEGGHNDFYNGGNTPPTPAVVYGRAAQLAAIWKAAGYKIVLTSELPAANPVYPANFDALRDASNALYRTGWRLIGDGFSDIASDSVIGPDGAEQNATYFSSSDLTHCTDAGYLRWSTYITPAVLSAVSGGANPLIGRGRRLN